MKLQRGNDHRAQVKLVAQLQRIERHRVVSKIKWGKTIARKWRKINA